MKLRRLLGLGCAIGSLGLATQAQAQAVVDFNPSTGAGSVSYDRATPGTETVTIGSPSAIVNWFPETSGTSLVFLPEGNTLIFQNGVSNSDFVVLNRIFTTINGPVRFDGTLISRIVDLSGAATPGGTVLFSSPGGIIVGATAVFDVGSLVLTSLNVVDDGAGNFMAPDGTFQFAPFVGLPAAGPVVTEAGAQINAVNEGSFVAFVAPQVTHGGSVRVNGSAAYIAGNELTMRVDQGLFDIVVTTGTDAATAIVHTGSTGGPASTGAGDNHAIYMVAVPINTAVSMMLEGDVGFDEATVAGVENGVIVLSAGYNVIGGEVDRYGALSGSVPGLGIPSTIQIQGGTFTSDVFGYAADIRADASSSGTLTFTQDVNLFGEDVALLSAGEGQTVTVMGDVLVSAARFDDASGQIDLVGGSAAITAAMGGSLHVFGNATIDASARGLVNVDSTAGSGTGGSASIFASGGTIQIDGDLTVLARGEGAQGPAARDGAGTGGTASIGAFDGGNVRVDGATDIDVSGIASDLDGTGGPGEAGQGGAVNIFVGASGTLSFGGSLTATAHGRGGSVAGGAFAGGDGVGGTIVVASSGQIEFDADLLLSADGLGGEGSDGGTGQGGDVDFLAAGGTIEYAGSAQITADGFGGTATAQGGTGGDGGGGSVEIVALGEGGSSLIRGGDLAISVQGMGGAGGPAISGPLSGGQAGMGIGGDVAILAEADNGVIQFGAVSADASGTGGDSVDGTAGAGVGGELQVAVAPASTDSPPNGSATFASLALRANGTAGNGAAGNDGQGGNINLSATGAPLTVTGLTSLEADGAGSGAGAGTGGSLVIATFQDTLSGVDGALLLGDVTGSASASADDPEATTAGHWQVDASGGDIAIGNITLVAGDGSTTATRPASGLSATGGTITVTQTGSFSTAGAIDVTVDGANRIAGGAIALIAGEDVTIAHANPVGDPTIDVTDLDIEAENVLFSAGSVTQAANRADIVARGDVAVEGRLDGGEIAITAAGVDVAAGGEVGSAATGLVDIDATADATIAGTVLGTDIQVDAANIIVAAGGSVGDAATDSVALAAVDNASISGSVLGGQIGVSGTTITVAASAALGNADTDQVMLNATGDTTIAGTVLGADIQVDAANITVAAGGSVGDAATDSVALAAVDNASISGSVLGSQIGVSGTTVTVASGGAVGGADTDQVMLDALGDAVIAGTVLGEAIGITSADIDIQSTAIVGDADTQLVQLNVRDTGQQTVIGGDTDGPGYTLTQEEALRIRADRLAIDVTLATPDPAGPPDVVIRDLELVGSGAANGVRAFTVGTNGILRVEGALALADALPDSELGLYGGERLEIVTPTGSARVRDIDGLPAGTLSLASETHVWVATQAVLDRLTADPNYAGRDEDLLDNGGVDQPEGFVEADTVMLSTGGTLFVQNTGGPDAPDFAGITVGPGGLVITTSEAITSPTTVVAFGRRINADGSLTTGFDFFREADYVPGTGGLADAFTGDSTFNTCIIVTGQCPGAPGPDGPTFPDGPDPTTGPTGGKDVILLARQAEEDDLVDTSFATEPLIEEPVTSGGESVLWSEETDCDRDNDGRCDEGNQ